ncbi:MAG TPA: hypothetical protein VFF06_05305 [Polyangia bacterium]|nr:hypothetical protein [Polyangia bacterium]
MKHRRSAFWIPALAAALACAAWLADAGCRRTALVGSLGCAGDTDCAPPSTVCGPDNRCIDGCVQNPGACVGGSTCDPSDGECSGGMINNPCSDDLDCDPPAVVCRVSTHTCVAGCTVSEGCAAGFACNPATGHCCDPSAADCPRPPDMAGFCNSDSECVGAPVNICSGGGCVPGCGSTGCTPPLSCNTVTGHCAEASCAVDTDCDPGSYCTQLATCSVLAFGGPIACAGGTKVSFKCAQSTSPELFAACVGAPGAVGCPYCIDGSCFHSGLCSSTNDCHREDTCSNGLCTALKPPCATTEPLADVASGKFAAGKELCVTGTITSAKSGFDGMSEFRLGSTPFLYFDLEAMYVQAGVRVPSVGETVTVHGTVRWDAGHNDRELLPVDWVSP